MKGIHICGCRFNKRLKAKTDGSKLLDGEVIHEKCHNINIHYLEHDSQHTQRPSSPSRGILRLSTSSTPNHKSVVLWRLWEDKGGDPPTDGKGSHNFWKFEGPVNFFRDSTHHLGDYWNELVIDVIQNNAHAILQNLLSAVVNRIRPIVLKFPWDLFHPWVVYLGVEVSSVPPTVFLKTFNGETWRFFPDRCRSEYLSEIYVGREGDGELLYIPKSYVVHVTRLA